MSLTAFGLWELVGLGVIFVYLFYARRRRNRAYEAQRQLVQEFATRKPGKATGTLTVIPASEQASVEKSPAKKAPIKKAPAKAPAKKAPAKKAPAKKSVKKAETSEA